MNNSERFTDRVEVPLVEIPAFEPQLSQLRYDFRNLWESTPGAFVPFGKEYELEQQRATEAEVEKTILSLEDFDLNSEEVSMLKLQRVKAAVRNLVVRSLDPEHREVGDMMLCEFSDAGDEFVRQAREFDPDLEVGDVFQALRNLWIINSMQVAFSLPVRVNPSGFAYSLLYPYTDNFLDASAVSSGEKSAFHRTFASRLAGYRAPVRTTLGSRVSDLVGMIESEYARAAYPDVYESLLAIHRAQGKSLRQHLREEGWAQPDILDISVEKGGSSVLADAYLAKGWLTREEAEFAFGYGVFLQFIDDLQDVDEDFQNGHQTLFTLVAAKGTLDGIANRLYRFLNQVLASSDLGSLRCSTPLVELVSRSCRCLILESIARNSKLFTDNYVAAVERYSPIRFDHIRKMHGKMKSKEKRLRKVFKSKQVLSAAAACARPTKPTPECETR